MHSESCNVRLYKSSQEDAQVWFSTLEPTTTTETLQDQDSQSEINLGYQCDGVVLFSETERAKSWYENPIFFRMGYNQQIKLNMQRQMV